MRVEGPIAQSGRLDVLVAELLGDISRSHAARLVRQGHVTVNGRPIDRPATRVHAGDHLTVERPAPVPSQVVAQDLALAIVYQDADVVVVDKAAGMVVHPGAGHPSGTLVNALLHHIPDLSGIGGEERPGIVHRLDRGTSGLLVVAKHDQAHAHLAAQFASREAGRTYLAICHDSPKEESGTIESELGRHPVDRVRMASVSRGGRPAITDWAVEGRAGTISLLKCTLRTGRTHQIRVHLSEQGWPIVGDPLYRRRNTRLPATLRGVVDPNAERPLLHAWRLRFVHPRTEERRQFEVAPPEDFGRVLDALNLAIPA